MHRAYSILTDIIHDKRTVHAHLGMSKVRDTLRLFSGSVLTVRTVHCTVYSTVHYVTIGRNIPYFSDFDVKAVQCNAS